MSLCNREASVVRPSVRLSASRYFYHKHDWIATKLTQHGPHTGLRPASSMCSRSRQGQRSRDTGTSVMSRNVCYTVPSDVLSLHVLTLRSTVTLSFQYKCQTARCNVYIMEWATLSFPAYSWVLAKRLLSGWLVGWLVGKSCLSRVACLSACGRGPPGPSVVPCAARRQPCVSTALQERRDSAECIIQRRFAIRVDSVPVPSCKLGSARQAPTSMENRLHF